LSRLDGNRTRAGYGFAELSVNVGEVLSELHVFCAQPGECLVGQLKPAFQGFSAGPAAARCGSAVGLWVLLGLLDLGAEVRLGVDPRS
jgi:hypothetical protein